MSGEILSNVVDMDQKKVWVFTFGCGSENSHQFVELYGTHTEARDEMFHLFGNRWAFQYGSREAAGVDKWGLEKMFVYSMLANEAEEYRAMMDRRFSQGDRARMASEVNCDKKGEQ